MLVTEQEAAERRCPNRTYMGDPQGFCLASMCMAWRWGPQGHESSNDPYPPGGGWLRAPIGSGFMWTRAIDNRTRGFCGIAGRPYP